MSKTNLTLQKEYYKDIIVKIRTETHARAYNFSVHDMCIVIVVWTSLVRLLTTVHSWDGTPGLSMLLYHVIK